MSGNGASNTLVGQPALDHQWYPIALSEDIAPGPHGVQVLGRRYALWRSDDGSLTAAPDRCPHRQAPLSEGRMVDGCLECPYHGWRFGTGGRCELVPSSVPGTPVPPKAHLETVNMRSATGWCGCVRASRWAGFRDPPGEQPRFPPAQYAVPALGGVVHPDHRQLHGLPPTSPSSIPPRSDWPKKRWCLRWRWVTSRRLSGLRL